MLAAYGKESHAEALRSARHFRQRLAEMPAITTRVFQANAIDSSVLRQALSGEAIDLVISDIPYGQLSAWQMPDSEANSQHASVWRMLDALLAVLSPGSIVAIAADKRQKIAHPGYRRLERFQVGKRQASLLQPL